MTEEKILLPLPSLDQLFQIVSEFYSGICLTPSFLFQTKSLIRDNFLMAPTIQYFIFSKMTKINSRELWKSLTWTDIAFEQQEL